MITSNYPSVLSAITDAIDRSGMYDQIVTVWVDNSTIDEAVDAIRSIEGADHELIEPNHLDCWGDDWRVIVRRHPD